jgi:large subunit ribosomal protein L13
MRKYYLFDAQGKVLGRLATEIARTLSGKGKVDYTPNVDGGDFVVVINTDGLVLTGNKEKQKTYYSFSGYPGGIKGITFDEQKEKDSRALIFSAVRGMLPKNKLRNQMMTRLLAYQNDQHDHKIDVTVK